METIKMFRNNCTLVAVKEISGASDEALLKAFRNHNYRDHKGMYADDYMAAARDLGVQFGEMKSTTNLVPMNGKTTRKGYFTRYAKPTLKMVLAQLKKGVWLVRTHRHVLVVRDGRVVDTNWSKPSLGRETYDYVEVLNPHTPKKSGFLKVARRNSRKYGSKSWAIGQVAFEFIRNNPEVTAEKLLKAVSKQGYHTDWLRWDMERGNIIEI